MKKFNTAIEHISRIICTSSQRTLAACFVLQAFTSDFQLPPMDLQKRLLIP